MASFWSQKPSPNFKIKTKNTSDIYHWKKCELCKHLTDNENQEDNSLLSFLFQFRVASGPFIPAAPVQGGNRTSFTAGDTPRHPQALWLGRFRHANLRTHTSLGCGRKPEHPGKSQQTWGHCANSTPDSGPGQELIFFHQCYKKTTLNKLMLF